MYVGIYGKLTVPSKLAFSTKNDHETLGKALRACCNK